MTAESWISDAAHINVLPVAEVQQLCRAMDFLLEAHDDIQLEVFWSVKNLFNVKVDLILVQTTSTYFEIQGEDADVDEDEAGDDTGAGLRRRGYSKDSPAHLAQAVLGFAVTRDGILVRCWVWPGNAVDFPVVVSSDGVASG